MLHNDFNVPLFLDVLTLLASVPPNKLQQCNYFLLRQPMQLLETRNYIIKSKTLGKKTTDHKAYHLASLQRPASSSDEARLRLDIALGGAGCGSVSSSKKANGCRAKSPQLKRFFLSVFFKAFGGVFILTDGE